MKQKKLKTVGLFLTVMFANQLQLQQANVASVLMPQD